jgi:hypothetical protein
MTKADRVLSTPPTNTSVDPTRRQLLTVAGGAVAAAIPTTTALTMAGNPDAELIELGAQFEPLVDRYYVAQRVGFFGASPCRA